MHDASYEIPRIGKFIKTECGLEVTGGWRKGEVGIITWVPRFCWDDEKVLERDSSGGCRTL